MKRSIPVKDRFRRMLAALRLWFLAIRERIGCVLRARSRELMVLGHLVIIAYYLSHSYWASVGYTLILIDYFVNRRK